jgi:hypothetical protein
MDLVVRLEPGSIEEPGCCLGAMAPRYVRDELWEELARVAQAKSAQRSRGNCGFDAIRSTAPLAGSVPGL